jgi:hypothetical protein
VTSPVPLTALDELERLLAAHEQWSTDDGIKVATTNGEVWNTLFGRPSWMTADELRALVDAHNAFPELVAAVRNVAALADEYTQEAVGAEEAMASFPPRDREVRDYYRRIAAVNRAKADRLRGALTSALSAGHTTTKETTDEN